MPDAFPVTQPTVLSTEDIYKKMTCEQPNTEIFQPASIFFRSKKLRATSCDLMECVHQTLDI